MALMWKLMCRAAACVATLCVLGAAGPAVLADEIPPQISLFKAQLEEARDRLRSVTYRAKDEGEEEFGEMGRRRFSSVWEIAEKGPLRASTRSSEMRFLNGRTPDQRHTTRAVLAASYHAHRWNETNAADQHVYESPTKMSKRARDQVRTFNGLSICNYGFGDGDLSFSAPYLHNPKLSRWAISEVPGDLGKKFECRRYRASDGQGSSPESVWGIDPHRGGLITRVVKFDDKGEAVSELTVDIAEASKGVFLPTRVTNTDYAGKDAAGAPVARTTRTITFTDVKPNADIPDSTFTLAYLGLKAGAIIQQIQPGGGMKPVVYAGSAAAGPGG